MEAALSGDPRELSVNNCRRIDSIMNTTRLLAAACRWTARIIGTVLVLMIVLLAIGEGMPNPFTQPISVQVGFLALALVIIGILGGWRWELAGGTLSLIESRIIE